MGPAPLAVPLLLLLLCRAGEAGECRGRRQLLNLPRPGYVTDGRGNYSVNGNCEWLITATNSSLRILLDFTTLDTECTYDYLFIYDGDSYASPLLASLSGNTIPPPIEARSGKMLLHLFSDANYNLEGFNATYTFTPCPMGCSGHGTCQAAGTCLCQAGWGGHDCGTQDCAEYCGAHGHCNTDNRCQCEAGFMGESCDLSLKDNQSAGSWYNISSSDPQFTGRTAAAGTFLNATNSLYIFGGYSLNTVLGDLVRYNFTSNTWQRSRLQPTPAARHSHCGLEWRGGLLVMGGELGNGSLTSDVWVYEPLADQWQRLQPLSARNPPGLASHAAALVDGSLYIYGGRTEQGRFSGAMFRLDLQRLEWEEVLPAGGKSPPVAAHSMVFHPPSRTLLIHGGHRLSPRFSYRTNSTDIFHVDRRYWSSLAPRPSAAGPRERAFHTATLVGNYMVVYGGNVHIHYQEEKCYDDRIFFYHLGCHQWVSGQELGLLINSADGREGRSRRGRYSHVAALMRGNVLLVAGGFSGQSLGDLVAYKLPVFVSHVMVQNVHVDYCSLYGAEVTCSKDPECVWCQNRCQSYQPHSTCPQRGCLGLSSLLTDCQSCLVFGQNRGSPPQTPGALGWCVQTATCLPVSEDAGCVVEPADGVDGWWGPDTTFLTSLEQCQRLDFSPGLHLLTYLQPRNYSQPDLVSVERSVSYVHAGAVELSAVLVYQGFIHPLFTAPSPADNVLVSLRLQRLYVEAQVARTPNLLDMEEVGHWLGQAGVEVRPLQRNSGDRLFPLLGRGNKYAIRIEASINNSGHGQPSEMSLAWQRPPAQDPHDITFHFLEAVRSESCELYPSCLACLSDQGCGWCPLHARCHPRSARVDAQCGRGGRLVLVPSGCPLCSEHTQCPACTQDPFCEWQAGGNRKTDFQCTRRGRSESAIRTPGHCPTPCHRRATCRDCLSNSSQCAWCQSTNTCFLFTTYLAKYPSGQCTDWYDSIHSVKQCRDCADFTGCQECVQNFQCGWCGNADNPTIGRCVAGDFSSVRGYPDCASAVRVQGNLSGSGAVAWSYAVCPDIDECRLQLHNCHPFASCTNTFHSFQCQCGQGYAGDGRAHCNRTCRNECVHGRCSGPPHFSCECALGWTSNVTSLNLTATECDVDCGCNFHSTCAAAGVGTCDQCQDWTMGEHCEECRPGSFGNGSGEAGCRRCACNGHGIASQGECERHTGHCYCTHHTEGQHCHICAAGYYGDPRDGGTCYRECGGRVLLPNVTSSALGSMKGIGISPTGLAYCLWALSVSDSLEPCPDTQPCPSITLTVDADISIECGKDYVYAFDGVPRFLTDSPPESSIYADPRLIGAFCGWGQEHPITVEAHSGVLIVYLEANVSRPAGTPWSGFNATYQLQECQPPCLPHRLCRGGVCQCREGVAGPDCPDLLCPNNCSWHLQAGYCHADSGRCVCAQGFAGSDCGSRIQPGTVVWETLTGEQSPAASGSPSPRLGHTMVEGPGSSLWVYGGLSISDGILSSLHSYSVPERRWRREMAVSGGEGPGPRYHHAAASDPSRHAMYLVGGLTPAGVASDSWRLDMVTRQWTLLTKSSLPAVCGHTLTLCRNSTLVLVGGYSPEDGFNHRLLQYQLHTHTWLPTQPAGTAPTGVYGHSAVYHGPTDALYVFGGYRFHLETVAASPELYGLHLPTLTWSLLAPSHGAKPVPRYFHVAGLLRDAVLVLGGRSHQRAFTNDILLYQINTNTWVTANSSELQTLGEGMPACIGHAAATLEGRVYVSGGYGGVGIGGLSSLWLPADPCHLLPSAAACNTSGGCVWCLSVRNGSCLSHQQAHRYAVEGVMPVCEPVPRQWESCGHLRTCSECLAVPPRLTGHPQTLRCKWCTNCPEGACIGTNASCSVENDCRINQRQIFLAANCSETTCEASDCPKCTRSGKCMWTRQFKRTGETRRILSVNPSYDWTCFSHSLRNVSPMPVESSPPLPCPTPCHNLTTCATCLSSTGSDGGWQRCVWSLALQQCMSPSFTPLRCGGGACGRTLQGGRDSCDVPCQAHGQCCQCLHHPHCGWCSASGLDGIGRCLPGGLPGPWGAGTGMCAETEGHWAFTWCPPENECVNGHHTCDKTQNCTDTPQGFECVCRDGYMQDSEQAVCRPVCEQGCVNGTCVEPNQCRCHFGWVGTDCSLLCHCNQHSECAGVTQRDQCLQCVHNTQGDHCDQCRPLFVGSALEGGWCRPCSSFCNNNSYVCITKDQYVKWLLQPASHPLQPDQISSWVTEGPLEETALCVQCQNHSSGERCESCLDGYFLLDGKCTKCQCNGHWDRCRTSDGTECQCQNNTETSCPTAQTDNKECYKYQCARCKENFLGNPTQGGQCYRQITVEQEYCFDPTSQSNCYHEPRIRNLASGRSVFFAVQPKFTNVDIRITVDVTFGQLDVYLSDSHSSFAVWVEPLTGRHRLVLTGAGQAGTGAESLRRRRQTGPERRRRAVNVSQPVEGVVERRAEGLTTYVTVVRPRTVLVVRALRERLVVTFPYQRHALKTQRFFLALLGTAAAAGETQGLLFFRQDQAHIDLFVFFSVFFSCFFLFLAACVLLWKAKQSAEERREHRRQLQEMDKMASRPFARLTVYLEPTSAAPVPTPSVAMPASTARTRRHGHLTGGSTTASATGAGATKPGPLTLEPTEDGLAAVATLLFHMPGGALAPNRACLGSALVALRHNLQEYCTAAAAQAAGNARKRAGGGGGHELTPMSL